MAVVALTGRSQPNTQTQLHSTNNGTILAQAEAEGAEYQRSEKNVSMGFSMGFYRDGLEGNRSLSVSGEVDATGNKDPWTQCRDLSPITGTGFFRSMGTHGCADFQTAT